MNSKKIFLYKESISMKSEFQAYITSGKRYNQKLSVNMTVYNENNKSIELMENFYVSNKNKKKHNLKIQVKLNDTGIYLRHETTEGGHFTEQLIRLEDIVGSNCDNHVRKRLRGGLGSCKRDRDDDEAHHHSENNADNDSKDLSAYLYIFAYIRKEKPLKRERVVRILRFRSFLSFEENLKCAERWHNAIKVNKRASDDRRPLLILLNPKSGSGKGRQLFQNEVAPILKEAEIQYEFIVTTHANYARDYIRQRKDIAQSYSGIVVASGDGLFFEVLNGIMERLDWRLLTHHLPLGIIPCGSGNGLAKTIAHLYNEPFEPKPILHATLACVSGKNTPLDVVRIELANGDKYLEMYSFLSVGWGLIADIDIESEKLRSIGAQRFTLWSIHRLLHLRACKGKVSYLPWRQNESITKTKTEDISTKQAVNEEAKAPHSILKHYHDFQEEENDSDTILENSEFVDIISHSSRKYNGDSWQSAESRRTAYYSLAGQSTRSQRSITASVLSKIEAANTELEAKALQSHLPPLKSPLPADWNTEEGEFIMVHAAYTTHLAADCLFAPESKLNDGIIYLVIIRAGISRVQLLNFLLSMSSGTHLDEAPSSHVQVLRVTAFRIEPHNSDGIITVDGERMEYGSIQAEMFPGLIKVMVPNTSVIKAECIDEYDQNKGACEVNENP
uniref:sphingosine kinase n=1 Tax=Glossina palpalis gambiensis TaxID=67801 RepID=A0A1B0B759_9MUSC